VANSAAHRRKLPFVNGSFSPASLAARSRSSWGGAVTQNTSSAVMQRRAEPHDSLDFFPTPPFGTRAICERIRDHYSPDIGQLTAWDPACGEHDMVRPLREYFAEVFASDIAQYSGGHEVSDFLFQREKRADWIITNPPFKLAERFIAHALTLADIGVAMLVRTSFLESAARYDGSGPKGDGIGLFKTTPPDGIFQFVERVGMLKGRLERDASTATAYCWLVWRARSTTSSTRFHWIAPCRKRLERDADYRAPSPPAEPNFSNFFAPSPSTPAQGLP
jgi:hypothetical protein